MPRFQATNMGSRLEYGAETGAISECKSTNSNRKRQIFATLFVHLSDDYILNKGASFATRPWLFSGRINNVKRQQCSKEKQPMKELFLYDWG